MAALGEKSLVEEPHASESRLADGNVLPAFILLNVETYGCSDIFIRHQYRTDGAPQDF